MGKAMGRCNTLHVRRYMFNPIMGNDICDMDMVIRAVISMEVDDGVSLCKDRTPI